jgi:hypothetical protein
VEKLLLVGCAELRASPAWSECPEGRRRRLLTGRPCGGRRIALAGCRRSPTGRPPPRRAPVNTVPPGDLRTRDHHIAGFTRILGTPGLRSTAPSGGRSCLAADTAPARLWVYPDSFCSGRRHRSTVSRANGPGPSVAINRKIQQYSAAGSPLFCRGSSPSGWCTVK